MKLEINVTLNDGTRALVEGELHGDGEDTHVIAHSITREGVDLLPILCALDCEDMIAVLEGKALRAYEEREQREYDDMRVDNDQGSLL